MKPPRMTENVYKDVAGASCPCPMPEKPGAGRSRDAWARCPCHIGRRFHTHSEKLSGRPAGFTLLEVILAVALVVMLMGCAYGFYRQVLDQRDRSLAAGDAVFAQRRVLDLMADEISATIDYPLLQMGLGGGGDNVTCMRTSVPSNAVYLAPDITRDTADPRWQPQHDVQQVTFRLRHEVDDDGVDQVKGLERACQRTVAAKTAEEGSDIQVSLLTEQVCFLRVQYWDGQNWQDAWSQRDLPLAVRICVGQQPLPEEMNPDEYPYPVLWRIIDIPASRGPEAQAENAGGIDTGEDFTGANVFTGGNVFNGGNSNPGSGGQPGRSGGPSGGSSGRGGRGSGGNSGMGGGSGSGGSMGSGGPAGGSSGSSGGFWRFGGANSQ